MVEHFILCHPVYTKLISPITVAVNRLRLRELKYMRWTHLVRTIVVINNQAIRRFMLTFLLEEFIYPSSWLCCYVPYGEGCSDLLEAKSGFFLCKDNSLLNALWGICGPPNEISDPRSAPWNRKSSFPIISITLVHWNSDIDVV